MIQVEENMAARKIKLVPQGKIVHVQSGGKCGGVRIAVQVSHPEAFTVDRDFFIQSAQSEKFFCHFWHVGFAAGTGNMSEITVTAAMEVNTATVKVSLPCLTNLKPIRAGEHLFRGGGAAESAKKRKVA